MKKSKLERLPVNESVFGAESVIPYQRSCAPRRFPTEKNVASDDGPTEPVYCAARRSMSRYRNQPHFLFAGGRGAV